MNRIAQWPGARRGFWAAACLSCVSIVTTDAAYGQTPPPCEPAVLTLTEAASLLRIDATELERLAEQKALPARLIGSSWRFNSASLLAWLNGDWELIDAAVRPAAGRSSFVAPIAPSLPTPDMAEVTARGASVGQPQPTPPSGPPSAGGQDRPVGEAPEERAADDIFLRGQRVLLGRGDVVVDFGLFYSRSDDRLLAAVDGGVGLATAEQEAFTTLLAGRVGIFDETELFAGTTFHSIDNHLLLGSTSLATSRRREFGGAQVGLRRTVLRETAGRPDIIVTLNGQFPTGHTPYALGGGLVLVKRVDPVVLFANANYLHAFRRGSSTVTPSWSENRLDVSIGYGLGINDTLAISMAVSGLFAGRTTLDNTRLRQPGLFSGRFGLTSRLARGLYIEPSVSFGLTGPRDSFAVGVTMPYAF